MNKKFKSIHFVKTKAFVFVFMLLNISTAFSGAIMDAKLVNEQELSLENIDTVTVRYRSENITLYKSNTDLLVIKEYMSVNNSGYYARIANSGNELIIEAGRRPLGRFYGYVDVYIPESNKNISIRTSSGDILAAGEYIALSIKMESSSGNITVNTVAADRADFTASSGDIKANTITAGRAGFTASSGSIRGGKINGNAAIVTNSGDIVFGGIDGNVSAESSSGRIELGMVNGTVSVKSSSGGVRCTTAENAGDISITTSSGNVVLNIPKDFMFNFFSRSSSGSLRTPFPEKLFIPVSDRGSVQGVIGSGNTSENQNLKNVNIKTSSGSISVEWAD
jgi:hypothetical protein